jgi:hypothetical protein
MEKSLYSKPTASISRKYKTSLDVTNQSNNNFDFST